MEQPFNALITPDKIILENRVENIGRSQGQFEPTPWTATYNPVLPCTAPTDTGACTSGVMWTICYCVNNDRGQSWTGLLFRGSAQRWFWLSLLAFLVHRWLGNTSSGRYWWWRSSSLIKLWSWGSRCWRWQHGWPSFYTPSTARLTTWTRIIGSARRRMEPNNAPNNIHLPELRHW